MELYGEKEICTKNEGSTTIVTVERYTRSLKSDEEDILELFEYVATLYECDLWESGFGSEYEDWTVFYLNHFNEIGIVQLHEKIDNMYETDDEEDDTVEKEKAKVDTLWLKAKPVIEKLQKEGWKTYSY